MGFNPCKAWFIQVYYSGQFSLNMSGILLTNGRMVIYGDISDCHSRDDGLVLASIEYRLGMLLNILQCIGQFLTTKNYLIQTVNIIINSREMEKP